MHTLILNLGKHVLLTGVAMLSEKVHGNNFTTLPTFLKNQLTYYL